MKRGAWFGALVVCVASGQSMVGCSQLGSEPSAQESSSSSESGKDDDSIKDDEEDDGDAEDTSMTSGGGQTTESSTSSGTSTSTTTDASGTTSTSATGTSTGSDSLTTTSEETGVTTEDESWRNVFTDWPENTSPEYVGRLLAERFLNEQVSDIKHYKVACAWYGALQIASLLEDRELIDRLTTKYDPLFDSYGDVLYTDDFGHGAGNGHVDENVFGIVPLQLALTHPTDERYRADGLALADHQAARLNVQVRGAIDDIFMMSGLQAQAHRVTGDATYTDRMAELLLAQNSRLLSRHLDDGLFNQMPPGDGGAWDGGQSHKWGRANGWGASGLTELLREMDEGSQHYDAIRSAYSRLMEGLLQYQIKDGEGTGIWRQIVDLPEYPTLDGSDPCRTQCNTHGAPASGDGQNYPETSGSSMFTYAMITGVKNGWLDSETYAEPAKQAWLTLVTHYMDPDGRLRDVSNYMYGGSVGHYVNREKVHGDNHGQAPLMWSAAALLR